MSTIRVRIPNSRGLNLSGLLELPEHGAPRAAALLSHCFTCNKNYKALYHLSRRLTAAGFGVLRYDCTGLGESEGEFAETNISTIIDDLVSAAQFLTGRVPGPLVLIGHSMGGIGSVLSAARLPAAALVTLATPTSAQAITRHIDPYRDEIERTGEARVPIIGRPFPIRKQFLEDVPRHDLGGAAMALSIPHLIVHATDDSIVPFEEATRWLTLGGRQRSLVVVEGCGHLFASDPGARSAGEAIIGWLRGHLPAAGEAPEPAAVPGARVVNRGEHYFSTAMAGRHALIVDEPTDLGGADLGPGPYALLLTSLGACTAMTLRMYADRKGWPLREVRVHLTHEKADATKSPHPDVPGGKIDRFTRELELFGDLDAEQRERLLDIANKCPVHKTLHSPVWVATALRSS